MTDRRIVALWMALALVPACRAAPAEGDPPATEDHAEEIIMTGAQVRAADIAIGTLRPGPAIAVTTASGVIEAVPDRTARIGSRVHGRIAAVLVNEGDRVAANAPLARVDSPELGQAKADFLAALAAEDLAAANAAREERLYRERISSEREWRSAAAEATRTRVGREAAEARLHALGMDDAGLADLMDERHYDATFDVRTPLAGEVVERRATVGEAVAPADRLFTVMDLRVVWARLEVFDDALADLAVGQSVRLTSRAFPGRTFAGRVDNIGAVVDPASRAVQVRVVVPNPDGRLRPGMFAEAAIERPLAADSSRLIVPAAAVQEDGGERIVFVAANDTTFERRVILTGASGPDWLEVRSGLAAGDRIVVRGAFVLKAESRKGELGEGHGH